MKDKVDKITAELSSQFPKTGPGRLCVAVIRQAMLDIITPTVSGVSKRTARQYLSGTIRHAELCGIESDWIRRLMKREGVEDETFLG